MIPTAHSNASRPRHYYHSMSMKSELWYAYNILVMNMYIDENTGLQHAHPSVPEIFRAITFYRP